MIDKYFYSILRDNNFKINNKLKKIATEINVLYLDRFDYACNKKKLTCKSTDLEGNPIYSDLGHLTIKGSIFLNELLNENNWFKSVNEFVKNK